MTIVAKSDIPRAWWKSAVVYQVYPASFLDTTGNGAGDLKGITSKVDYLKDLGVDVLYLCPIFKSPQADLGYDISDYQDVHAPYGTVADVDNLIAELAKRDMKLVLDLVVNHTSDEHPWFIESRSSKTNPKRDWYFWRPPKYDENGNRKEPNNWESVFGGSAWTYCEQTGEYYLHLFDTKQPDLNWDCDEMRPEIYKMMRWWLDKGVAGYRMDVIARISKYQDLPDAEINNAGPYQQLTKRIGPRLHEFLHEMNREVLSKYDILTVGEINKVTPEGMLQFVHPDRNEIASAFCFDHCNVGLKGTGMWRHVVTPWKLSELKNCFSRWQWLRDAGAWHALYLENHDQPRSISRWCNDSPEWRWQSGRLLCMLHTTLFGTLYIYQGEEIGMINLPNDWPLEEWKDVQTQNIVREFQALGENVEENTKQVYFKARDNSRSPVQWSAEVNGGFSTGKPWMRVPEDYKVCNVEAQINDPDSLLSFWKEMVSFRKANSDILIYGSFRELTPEDERVFAYVRDEAMLVVLNFTDKTVEYGLPEPLSGKLIKSTTDNKLVAQQLNQSITLPGYSGAVYQLEV